MSTPASLIADRYRLVKMLGSGGMGVVWHAWDERLRRPVALKMLRSQPEVDESERGLSTERAMREARITAGLHHPHAVTVFDVIEHEGWPCIVMQLIDSTPLSALLKEHGPMTPTQAAGIGGEVASASAEAHRLRIVHRDVKPGNILITADGSALISDFGISHALGDATITATGLIHGTPAYLAPEVAKGLPTSFASDVFSLGSTIYSMLEGTPPFGTDGNAISLLHRVARGGYATPKNAGPLAPLLKQMLATNPKRRPTMAAVAESLSAWQRNAGHAVFPDGVAILTAMFDRDPRERSPWDATTEVLVDPPPPTAPADAAGLAGAGAAAGVAGAAGAAGGAGPAGDGVVSAGEAVEGPATPAAMQDAAADPAEEPLAEEPPADRPPAESPASAGESSPTPPALDDHDGLDAPDGQHAPAPDDHDPAARSAPAALATPAADTVHTAKTAETAAADEAAKTIPADQPTSFEPPTAETEHLAAAVAVSQTAETVPASSGPPRAPSTPAPPRPPTQTPAAPATSPGRRRRTGVIAVILVLVAVLALGAGALFYPWRSPVDEAGTSTSSPAVTETESAQTPTPTPTAEAEAAPPAPSEAAPTPQATQPPPVTPEQRVVDMISGYYALLPSSLDGAWPYMTADYQENHAGGRGGYESFWSNVASLEIAEVSASAPDRGQATLTYHFTDGRVVQEVTSYRLVDEGGVLKIAETDVLSSVQL